MKRHLLSALLLCQLLLQNVYVKAQVTKLEGSTIMFELPGSKWKLIIKDHSGPKAIWVYQRESMPGDDSKPVISFMTEEMSVKLRLGQYHIQNMKLAKITETHDFGVGKVIGLVNATLSKGYFNNDSVYFGVAVNGSKGLTILCSAKGLSFEKYDAEFRSFLGSLGYGKVSTPSNSTGKTNTPVQAIPPADVTKSKEIVSEKEKINGCAYFPVTNGMKFTYKRNDMTGEHSIVESYTVVKDKTLKSGKVIKGYKINTTVANRNNTIIFYYCENGSMKMYSEMPAYNTYIKEYVEDYSVLPSDYNKPDYQKTPVWETEKYGSGKYLSFTELKDGGEGTEWTDRQVVNNNPVTINSEIVETGLSLTVQGKKYSPVIHVERTVTINYMGEDMELNTQDIYYARGVGKIKVVEKGKDLVMGNSFTTTQELVSHNLPAQLNIPENKPGEEIKKENTTKNSAKEKVDESLTGTWKNFRSDRSGGMTLIYRLNPDGTFEYYTGSPVASNLAEKGSWNMNKDTLVLSVKEARGNAYFYTKKYPIQKINNAYSGKPSLVFTWTESLKKEFETMDNKNPWKDMPAYGDKMEPQINENIILKGEIDPEIEGEWHLINNHSYLVVRPDEYYKFNKDGTGEIKTRIFPLKKFEWRINNGQMCILTDCGIGDKCMNRYTIAKKTIPTGKPAIEFDGLTYIRQ